MIVSVVIASALVFSWKLLGYLLPERLVTPKVRAFSERVTIALLAALVAVQGFTAGGAWQFDARVPALVLAAILLWRKVPFLIVVVAAAALAGGIRALGL